MSRKSGPRLPGKQPTKADLLAAIQRRRLGEARTLGTRLCELHPNDAEAWFLLGSIHGGLKDFPAAAQCCHRAVTLQPANAMGHHNLGIALSRSGQFDTAIDAFRQTLKLRPDMIESRLELANALQLSGDHQRAIDTYRQVLAQCPDLVAASINLAHAYVAAGSLEASADVCQRVLKQQPDQTEALRLLADINLQCSRFQQSCDLFRRLIHLNSGDASAYAGLGRALKEAGQLDEALESTRRAASVEPNSPAWQLQLGTIYQACEELEQALECYRSALMLAPDLAPAINNIGLVLQAQNRADEAIGYYHRAIALAPDQIEAYVNLAKSQRELNQLEAAAATLDEAVARQPDAVAPHWDRSLVWLQQGDFSRGWPEYEWRWEGKGLVRRGFPQPLWDGAPLQDKTLLVHAEQGIGDEIMFASCFPELLTLAGHLIIDCDPRLAPLFARSFPRAHVHGGTQAESFTWLDALPRVDFQSPAGSLLRHLRPTLATFPAHTGYLQADPVQREHWRRRLEEIGPGLKVGISWRGGRDATQKAKRSIRLSMWEPILEVPGVQFVSLQYGDCVAELEQAREQLSTQIKHLPDLDPVADLDRFAALIAALDLVISVDNSTVHLAGALNTPVWCLQPFAADWRWLSDTEHCHWYPSLIHVRQRAPGQWDRVIARASDRLQRLVGPGS